MIIDEENYLEHFGVRGMKWGVRKDRDSSNVNNEVKDQSEKSQNPKLKTLIAAERSKPKTIEQAEKLATAEKTFEKKFAKSEADDPKGWRPTGKQVAVAAAGAVAVGLILYKVKTGNDFPDTGFSIDDYKKAIPSAKTPSWVHDYAGKKMDIDEYAGIVGLSKDRIWANSMITTESFNQGEQTLQAGHEFFRVTHGVEKSFRDATYTVTSKEDLARYALGWKSEDINVVGFKAKEAVRVADLHTSLESMREVLVKNGVKNVKPKDVIKAYTEETGHAWVSNRAVAFMDTLKSKGYDAIIDDMDAGVYGETPLVLFNHTKMTSKTTTLANDYDFDALKSILTEIPNRR